MYFNKIKPYFYLAGVYLSLSVFLRLVFFFHPITTTHFTFFEAVGILLKGTLADIPIFILASLFLALYFLTYSNRKFEKPWGGIILGILVVAFLYVWLVPNNIFKQYGGGLNDVVMIFVGLKTLAFALMLFLPKYRLKIRNGYYFFTIFLYVLLIIFNGVSEYFFWNEFGVRYNFIAVDYLIYTNEVIGNIMESYPVIPLFLGIFAIALLLSIWIFRKTKDCLVEIPNIFQKIVLVGVFVVICGISLLVIPKTEDFKAEDNFVLEIQSNGFYKFYYAFTHNELDFFKFYSTLPVKEAEALYLKQFNPPSILKPVQGRGEEVHKNVVLISVESLSAEYMRHFGNTNGITPFLDSLADKSLFCTNFYATGNRTVRGLEALTLCIPPTPGESIIKREDNKNKFSTGSIFKAKGYQVKFLYGGYSYFDNMKDFFEGNGYGIVDRDSFRPDEITFANVWGVCDEDMAKKAIQVMNEEYKTGKPFFNHWMTVSNHRPFTYPNGKIDIPGDAKSRDGGVKYTDYALKQFFAMAEKEPWFKNTIFVIVADHCASSAGKTELPMDKYRIPAIIYSQDFIEPQQFTGLMSQMDLMPTVMGLMNFSYQSKFMGEDVFGNNYKPRAYIATYQDLGLIKNDTLTIISPVKQVKQYALELKESDLPPQFKLYYKENPVKTQNKSLLNDCIATYESVSQWLKNHLLDK
ncbi:LTA synthase family protein [Riemerella columbipharyngis]|uniref:Phosphoglycerol transferase MdoB n=1 Tax=Riemerella columbipharyngis TaxID=1071918 RepID=A0A1G7EEC4_9FLAO|nr:LTA synthase family protein [Riemerella columbipharyngis]SDE62028.1 Phosphoglycerol transferase MdoB [Riemerella columbipharyngis]